MTARKKRLLLWDIDGTLITTGAAGQRAIVRATAQWFGNHGDLSGIEIAGRTDVGIAHQILKKHRELITDEKVTAFLDLYLKFLEEELPRSKGSVLPGVRQLLEQFFEFGAFADDHHDRNELGAFALERAEQETGIKFSPEQVDVIGDTGHDIACGKAFGARTIAVATGSWSREKLAAEKPDFLFNDLGDVDDAIATLKW